MIILATFMYLFGFLMLALLVMYLFMAKKRSYKIELKPMMSVFFAMVLFFSLGVLFQPNSDSNNGNGKHITTATEQGHKEISAGQVFGEKTTQTLNEQSQYVAHTQLDNGNMEYMDTINDVKMNRIDDYTTGVTTVYLHDDSKSDGLGRVLYTGKTIAQDDKKKTVVVE